MSEAMSSQSPPPPLLELKDVWRSYNQGGSKLDVLTGASLTVRAGEMKALVGPSGSGKSTLLNIAGLLEQPDSGTVFINAVDSAGLRQGKRTLLRRQHIGFVFQFHRLLPEFSALENVALPLRLNGLSQPIAEQQSRELLDRIGLGARLQHLPGQLSGGERQRVAVARALIHQPKLVMADEPTGNLDTTSAAELMALMVELSESSGVAFLVVTHDPSMLHQFDRVLTLVDGKLQPDSARGDR